MTDGSYCRRTSITFVQWMQTPTTRTRSTCMRSSCGAATARSEQRSTSCSRWRLTPTMYGACVTMATSCRSRAKRTTPSCSTSRPPRSSRQSPSASATTATTCANSFAVHKRMRFSLIHLVVQIATNAGPSVAAGARPCVRRGLRGARAQTRVRPLRLLPLWMRRAAEEEEQEEQEAVAVR